MPNTIFLYNENCRQAGLRDYRITEGDSTEYPVSVAQYIRFCRMARRAHAGRDLFLRRCARAVMHALRYEN